MWISSVNSTLKVVEFAGKDGRGESSGELDGGDMKGVRGGVSGHTS